MPSFDIVSRTDMAEVDNALNALKREIGQRFDFKGSKSENSAPSKIHGYVAQLVRAHHS